MAKIFLYSTQPVSARMAGPALRYREIAQNLASEHQVVLGVPNQPELNPPDFKLVKADGFNFRKLLAENEIIISHLLPPIYLPFLGSKILVLDLYNLVFFENLELLFQESSQFLRKNPDYALRAFLLNLLSADFILCAGERQKDVITGMLLTLGRLKKELYQRDRQLKGFLEIMPFGLPGEEPQKTAPTVKGVIPGIAKDDFLLLWAGGVWEWFDPLTLIKAIEEAARQNPRIKLLFLGCSSPVKSGEKESRLAKAVRTARELDLLDKFIFFREWVPYQQRADYYLEADCGLSIHLDILETRYAFRTRLMDYFWARLPVICSKGDQLSELVEKEHLGLTVPVGEEKALAAAILKLAGEQQFYQNCRLNLERIRRDYTWDKVLTPLREFCANPGKSPAKAGFCRLFCQVSKLYLDRLLMANFR